MELNQATSKRGRASTSSSPADDLDRLSALPDCLLHTIMSFMKARQAVQTCMLSSRWRHLWRSVPCLDLDLDEFMEVSAAPAESTFLDDYEDHRCITEKEWERFEDFVFNLMLHRSIAMLHSFRLSLGSLQLPTHSRRQAAGWIRRAMKYWTSDPAIRREGLSSGSWRLRRLDISLVFLDDVFAKHVSSMCHFLEDLKLEGCTCQIDSITSRSLKKLVLKNCSLHQVSEISCPKLKNLVINGGSNTYNAHLVISAPAVAHLHLGVAVSEFHGGISVIEMPSLAKALVHLVGHPQSALLKSSDQSKLLRSVSNATSLDLFGFKTLGLDVESTTTGQEFKNLRNLVLDSCDLTDNFHTLGLFLQNATNLEKLTLRGFKVLSEECTTTFQEFKNMRNLLLDRCDLTDDFHTLGLFLQNAPNLEKLTLRYCWVSINSMKKKGTPGVKDTPSSKWSYLDFQCENLKLTEIIYRYDDICRLQFEFMTCISGKLPKNYIKLTKVD